ncbi:hypothetical protein C2857_003000 [Epichloe festucae Fl1]|uniref:Uncharacterized protein n=1 Tax=Epichloe festucae (strain Fl1) TaxID=877507 RepID=A0A7U3SMU2_EPIFF|nr:hypothetical protein C2857_003000 [Epichloe festucae Fl1]
MASNSTRASQADPEADLDISLTEHDRDSDTTNSTVITSDDLARQVREYEKLVAETYRHGTYYPAYPKP